MSNYMNVKTTLGHKYRMRTAEDHRMEKILFALAITVIPFVAAAGMLLLWIKGV